MKLITCKPIKGLYAVIHRTSWSETTYHIKAKNGLGAIHKLTAHFDKYRRPYDRNRITTERVYETAPDIIEVKDDTWGD